MLLDVGLGPHDDRAAARSCRPARCRRGRGSSRRSGSPGPGTISISSSMRDRRIVDQRDAGVDHLAEIVRRDVGRHADRDAAGAVDEQVREAWPAGPIGSRSRAVVVRLEVDRVLVDVVEQRHGARLARRDFGVAHRPPADRRRPSRNCPARRSAAGASRSPAPCAPGRRRSIGRRADGTYPSRRRRRGRDLT